ncbi:MAG: hypothetical protein AMXMBFR4_29610 [Candidatus Hydrogenedentota bacterium]
MGYAQNTQLFDYLAHTLLIPFHALGPLGQNREKNNAGRNENPSTDEPERVRSDLFDFGGADGRSN